MLWTYGSERRGQLVTDAGELWKSCSDALQVQVSEATWRTWFEALEPVSVDADSLVLAVPSNLVRERLAGRFLAMVEDAVAEAAGYRLRVDLDVRPPAAPPAEAQIDLRDSADVGRMAFADRSVTARAELERAGAHVHGAGSGTELMTSKRPSRPSSPNQDDGGFRPPDRPLNR